jgi:hypothetical protein
MFQKSETRIFSKPSQIAFSAGDQVIDCGNFMPIAEKTFAEMRANETSATGDNDTHGNILPTNRT